MTKEDVGAEETDGPRSNQSQCNLRGELHERRNENADEEEQHAGFDRREHNDIDYCHAERYLVGR